MPRRVPLLLAVAAYLALATAVPAPAAAAPAMTGLVRVDPSLVTTIIEDLPDDPSPPQIAGAIRRLYDLGYFSWVRVTRDPDGQLVWRFRERPFVVGVERQGITELSDEKVDKAVQIQSQAFLDPTAIGRTEDALEELYREEGFAESSVVVRTESAGPTGEVTVVIESREVEKVRIVEVRMRGNEAFTDRELRQRMESRSPGGLAFLSNQGVYDRQAADRDRFRIEAAYLEEGYLKVAVEGPDVTYLPPNDRVLIEYDVADGLQYFLGELSFAGDLFFRRSTLEDWIGLEPGEPVNRIRLDEGTNQIVEAYSDFGFAFARVIPNFRFDDAEQIADVELTIDRGPMVYVRDIRISGNTKTRDKVVRRELQIAEGELYSGRAVRLSRERVQALGFFEAVTFETDAVGEDLVDLKIQVTERPTGTASAGVGYSSIDKFVGNLRLNFGNLAGYGLKLNLQAEFGGRRQSFNVGFDDPYFLDSPFSLGVEVFSSRQEFFSGTANVQSFTQRNRGGSLSLGYKLALYTRFILTFRDELIKFSDISIRSRRFFTDGETRSIQPTLRRDSRNHPFDPSRGNLTLASVEFAGGNLGGDHTFTKYRLMSQQFIPIFNFLTLSLKAEAGLSTTRGDRVPFAERYFVGGIYTLRGYDFRAVGPSVLVASDPENPGSGVTRVFVGGNKQVLLSSELLFPLIPPAGIKGVLFFDAGNTWLEEDEFFATPLRMGYGFGFRWFSPIGPLRFEWGFPVDPRPDERERVFEFSIGSFF